MHDEPTLIRRILDGETAGFEVLVHRYQGPVFGLVRNLAAVRGDVEELAHDTFVSAFEHLRSFDPARGSFRAWLLTIARNKCRNARQRRRPVDLEPSMTPADPRTPVQHSADREALVLLDQALAELPEEQRAAFVMAELLGLSHAEIRVIEDVEPGTVKSRIARARQRLRSLLPGIGEPT